MTEASTINMPHSPAVPLAPGSDPYGARCICDGLRLYRICPKSKCRRAGGCRGAPHLCIRDHGKIVPREVWDWVGAILTAKEEGLDETETMEAVEPHMGAFVGWVAGLEAALARR